MQLESAATAASGRHALLLSRKGAAVRQPPESSPGKWRESSAPSSSIGTLAAQAAWSCAASFLISCLCDRLVLPGRERSTRSIGSGARRAIRHWPRGRACQRGGSARPAAGVDRGGRGRDRTRERGRYRAARRSRAPSRSTVARSQGWRAAPCSVRVTANSRARDLTVSFEVEAALVPVGRVPLTTSASAR
jgi:hypothetical protein